MENKNKHENGYPSTSRGGYQDLYSIAEYLVQLSPSLDCWRNFKTLVGQGIHLPTAAEPTRAPEVLREDGEGLISLSYVV